jgi:hypothetical protein
MKSAIILISFLIFSQLPSYADPGMGMNPGKNVSASLVDSDEAEKDVVPISTPLWFKSEWVAKEWPSKDNADLSLWCSRFETQLRNLLKKQEDWKLPADLATCYFLIDHQGDIFAPCVDHESQRTTFSFVSKIKSFQPPPSYLAKRRLRLSLRYPKQIDLFIDFHEPENDEKYFDHLKRINKA